MQNITNNIKMLLLACKPDSVWMCILFKAEWSAREILTYVRVQN